MSSKSKKSAKIESAKTAEETTSVEQSNNEEKRQFMITEAAYYRAEYRSFAPDHELEDWLEAEKQINEMLEAA